ncbi:MAG: PQQ-binding-like beta-propeller repeat protein [Verrucomicrobiota bacterium]
MLANNPLIIILPVRVTTQMLHRMAGFLFGIAASAIISNASGEQVENWPEFRGPTGQGHSMARNLPLEWKAASEGPGTNIVWKQGIPGKGWSSPVFYDGRIYLTSAVGGNDASSLSLRAICVNASDGRILWNAEVFSRDNLTRIHEKNSHASPTPLVEGNRLYVHFGHNGTACLDLRGNIVWRNTSIVYEPVHGSGGSPILADDKLIFSCDGASDPFVVALDKATGKVLWKTRRESDAKKKFSFSTPLLIDVEGQKQVISPGSGVVCAYDPATGREIWRVRYDGYSVVPRPVYGHGLVFFSTGFDHPSVMAIRPNGLGDVTETHVVWTVSRGAPNTPSPLLVGEELYLVSDIGLASCLDAQTGKVYWQERVVGNCSGSPVYAGGRIYIQDEQGLGVVIKPGRKFQKLAGNPLGERTLASYAIGDDALFIRGEVHLYRIQSRTGP